jgi:hypothetical protein
LCESTIRKAGQAFTCLKFIGLEGAATNGLEIDVKSGRLR